MLKYMRIAVTACCLTACMLLIALWMRSYWWEELVFRGHWDVGGSETTACIGTYEGTVYLWHGMTDNLSIMGGDELNWQRGGTVGVVALRNVGPYRLELQNGTKSEWEMSHDSDTLHLTRKFQWNRSSGGDTFVCIPHWFLVLLTATIAALPWLSWSKRFSLRTLLIATTLVAVGMGIIVWSS